MIINNPALTVAVSDGSAMLTESDFVEIGLQGIFASESTDPLGTLIQRIPNDWIKQGATDATYPNVGEVFFVRNKLKEIISRFIF